MTGVAGTGTSCGGAGRLIPIFTLTWPWPGLGPPNSIKIVMPPKNIRRSIGRFLLLACRDPFPSGWGTQPACHGAVVWPVPASGKAGELVVKVETSWRDRNFIPATAPLERATEVNSREF